MSQRKKNWWSRPSPEIKNPSRPRCSLVCDEYGQQVPSQRISGTSRTSGIAAQG